MKKDNKRVSIHWMYYQTCHDHVREYENICESMEKHRSSGEERYIIELNLAALYEKRERSVTIPIVYSAMCLEAFIYDYGASNISDSFMKKHIDKLDLPSKYVIVTKLVTGKDFPKQAQAYEGLKKLVKDRNKLVHFKSRKYDINDIKGIMDYHDEMNEYLSDAMYSAYHTVEKTLTAIDKLHENKTNYCAAIMRGVECHA